MCRPHVRLATAGDVAEIARLMAAFRDHLGYERPSDEAIGAGVGRLFDDPATEFLLAFGGDGPAAGVAQLRFRWGIWRNGGDCLLEDLFVESEARGAGLGRLLVELATERALARGCRRMELDASEDNAAALALYRSFGFSERPHPSAPRDLYLRRHIGD